jgi:hypothetical protein
MHHFNVLLNFVGEQKRVGIHLCLSEDNRLTVSSIADQNVLKSLHPIVERTIDRKMLNFFCSFVRKVLSEINIHKVSFHVF